MQRTMVKALICVLFCAALALPALAQSANPSPEPSEIGRVTTTDRQEEPITRTSRPTYVVDRRSIEETGARSIAQALRMIPGTTFYRYGAYGAVTNYGLLGATSEQTLVLLNGFPIAPASSASIDLGNFSTAGVDRIEIVEGGGSTLYGTNAVGGIINIITGNAPLRPLVELSAGTLGDRDLRFETRLGGFSAALERRVATNVYDFPALDGFPAGTRTNSQAMGTVGRFSYRSDATKRWSFDVAAGDNALSAGVPGGLSFLTPNARQMTAQSDGHITVSLRGERSLTTLSYSAARQALAYNDPDNGGESDTYDSRSQVSLRSVIGSERSSLVSGIDLARETAIVASTPAALSQSAAYAQYRAGLAPNATLTLGLRSEHDTPQGSVLLPAIGAQLHFGTVRFSANLAGTFRTPTMDELYYPGFSNPLLVPERSSNFDATVAAPLGGGSISLNWFNRYAVNLIALDANFTPQNIAHASLAGLVFLAHSAPVHGIVGTIGITNLYRALNLTPGATPVRLNFDPVLTTLVGIERPLVGSNVGFGINARVDSPHVEGGPPRNGATTVDAYVRARLERATALTVRARNLGNERYAPIEGYPAPGRTIEVELSTR